MMVSKEGARLLQISRAQHLLYPMSCWVEAVKYKNKYLKDWLQGLQNFLNTHILDLVQKRVLRKFWNARNENLRFKEAVVKVD